MSEFNSKFGGGGATIAMPRIRYLSAHANISGRWRYRQEPCNLHFEANALELTKPVAPYPWKLQLLEDLILWITVSCSERAPTMERIRVRVEVLPWSNPTELLRDEVKSHQDATRPYLEPCAQEVTINELAERIKNRFMNIHRR